MFIRQHSGDDAPQDEG